MRLNELISPKTRTVKTKSPFNIEKEKADAEEAGLKNAESNTPIPGQGAFATAKPHSTNPHMYVKSNRVAGKLKSDPYYQWISAVKKLAGSNPYLPRVYDIKLETDSTGAVKPHYTIEKLIDGTTLDKELTSSKDGLDEYNTANHIAIQIGGEKYSWISNWHWLIKTLRVDLNKNLQKFVDPQFVEAFQLVKTVTDSNPNFHYDLHPGNFMIRLTSVGPQLVITDPIASFASGSHDGTDPA